MRRAWAWAACVAAACFVASCERGEAGYDGLGDPGAELAFAREGEEVARLTLAELAAGGGVDVVGHDPYYDKDKKFRAVGLVEVLERVYGPLGLDLREQEFILRASDGYTVPLSGERIVSGRPLLAYADLEVEGWEPIGPQQADPGPFYMVWAGAEQKDLEQYPRPWQLARVEIAPFEQVFPKTLPTGMPEDSAAWRGFAIYKEQCVRCHAMNQQGGRVGPEFNVPQNITEYRPEEQIRAYIRNPRTFRYGNMPPFEHLSEGDLDDVLAYLRAMKDRKDDPAVDDGG